METPEEIKKAYEEYLRESGRPHEPKLELVFMAGWVASASKYNEDFAGALVGIEKRGKE